MFNFIDWCNLFFMLLNLIKGNPSVVGHFPAVDIKMHDAGENRLRRSSFGGDCLKSLITTSED